MGNPRRIFQKRRKTAFNIACKEGQGASSCGGNPAPLLRVPSPSAHFFYTRIFKAQPRCAASPSAGAPPERSRIKNENAKKEFVLFTHGAEDEIFFGCALKASAADRRTVLRLHRFFCAASREHVGIHDFERLIFRATQKARHKRAFRGADWVTLYELKGKEEADREHSPTCFSIFSTYDLEKRFVEELYTL